MACRRDEDTWKPCARSRCTGRVVKSECARRFDRRRYCSVKCAVNARFEAGWRPPQLTPEQRRRAGQIGGRAGGRIRTQLAAIAAAERIGLSLPPEVRRKLTDDEEKALLVTIGRSLRLAYKRGADYERLKLRAALAKGKGKEHVQG